MTAEKLPKVPRVPPAALYRTRDRLAPTVDPEAWQRYPNLPHDCTPDHPGRPEHAHTCRPAYNPDGLTSPEAIRARWAALPTVEPEATA